MSDTYEFATHRRLQQLPELFDAKTRRSDDGAPECTGTVTMRVGSFGYTRACLQLGGFCARTDQNQTQNI